MSISDLDFALSLTTLEGWSTTKKDFEELLQFNPRGSFIGEVDGDPVGMVCTVNYGEFGFIANLIVQDIYRGQNFGRILMEFAMKYLLDSGVESILLDGVPKAVPLYERLGFRKIERSLRLEANITGRKSQHTRPMIENDLEEIAPFDSQYFGCQRDFFLRMRLLAYPEFSRVIELDGEIRGFIMGSWSGNSMRIGPWVMKAHDNFAECLLREFVEMTDASTFKIGVLESNVQSVMLLKQTGFEEKSYSWRMVYGKNTEATLSNHLYAIFSPVRG
jgi:ribosomal protein S18 acetylase RimI-like enzyme